MTLITKPSTQADTLLRRDPLIERIVDFERNPRSGAGRHDGVLGFPRLVADLRACGAEACVLLHHGASLAVAMRLAGIPERYGYGYSAVQRAWLNRPPYVAEPPPFTEAFVQAQAWAAAAGFGALPEPHLEIDPAARARLHARLDGVQQPCAVLGIGAHGIDRQWGAANFAALAHALRRQGLAVLLLAGTGEVSLVRAVQAAAPDTLAAIGWPLDEVVALLAEAALFVGNDSGPANLRAAVGRAAHTLFGASGPLRHSAFFVPIIPPAGPRSGMAGITVDQVTTAILA